MGIAHRRRYNRRRGWRLHRLDGTTWTTPPASARKARRRRRNRIATLSRRLNRARR